ncbi:uncharacterized protein H6S33_008144, partial [Morchella sextelata]|uniref:uncharacterized protein n=1 Tax=Morchella sextelata TaxID=1174677 RepID=UPI001D040552
LPGYERWTRTSLQGPVFLRHELEIAETVHVVLQLSLPIPLPGDCNGGSGYRWK